MSFIKDPMSFTTTRMKSIIPNRLPFRHSLKGIDASESAIPGHDVPPSNSVNVVLFGETGVGKSSVINLIAQRTLAKVSSDVNGCTMESTKHDIEFDGMNFAIFDTIGLEEPQMGVNGYLKAIEKAYELITKLNHAGGVHLLLFCMRGGRITATTQSNYRLFCELLCSKKVPIALVFTGLEREVEMEDWWRRNHKHIEGYGIKSDGHACVTAVLDNDAPGEDLKYNESRVVIRDLLKTCALKNTAYSPDTISWFARLGRDMMSLIEKRMSPKRKKVLKVLVKRCKLDPETAKKIADMMEKDDPSAPSGTAEQVNLPDPEPQVVGPEEGGGSGDGDAVLSLDSGDEISDDEEDSQPQVVDPPSSLDATLPRKTAETGQRIHDAKKEKSRSDAESSASGRQKSKHGNISTAIPRAGDPDRAGTTVHGRARPLDGPPNLDGPDKIIDSPIRRNSKRLAEKSIPDTTTRTISSSTAKESVRATKEQPNSERGSIRTTKEEFRLEGTGRAVPSPSVREGTRPKEMLIPGGVDRATPSPSVKESVKPTNEGPILATDGAGRATPSPNTKEGTKPSRQQPYADTRSVREGTGPSRENPGPNATSVFSSSTGKESVKTTKERSTSGTAGRVTPSPRESIRTTKEKPIPEGANRSILSSSIRESVKPAGQEPIPAGDGAGRATPDPSAKEGTKPSRKQFYADTVPFLSESRVYAGGSTGQPRNAGSSAQQDRSAVVPSQTRTGRGGFTGQSSSHS